MTLLHRLASVVRWIVRRSDAEQELEQELQSFVEMSAAGKIRDGVPPAEARRLALLEFRIEQTKERVRRYRHGGLLDEIGRDIHYAFRMFGRNRGFVAVIVLTLALGIGANTAIFSLIDALMLRSLPVHNPQELVQVHMRLPGDAAAGMESFSYAMVRALANQDDVFAGVAGFSGYGFNVGSGDSMRQVPGAVVTGEYYQTMGLTPEVGRLLTPEDDEPGAPPAAVISDGYWERQFQRNPAVAGQTIRLNGASFTVVGVSPPGFTGANVGAIADITIAVAALPAVNPQGAQLLGPGNFWLRVLARPAPGVSNAQATSRLSIVWRDIWDSVIAAHWPAQQRAPFSRATFELAPGGTGWTFMRGMYREPLMVLMAIVGLVLLIACANVATLMLARAAARHREIGVRLAIGAPRARIVRQLLIESVMLSAMGGVFGVALAWVSSRFLVDVISTGQFRVAFDLTPNLHILGFTAAVALITGILFGVAPAFHATLSGPSPALKEDARTTSSRSRLLAGLVSLQVALSLLLLVGAGLFIQTLRNLQNLNPGFDRQGVLIAEINDRRDAIPPDLLERVRQVPGVRSASVSTHTPLSGSVWSDIAVPRGSPIPQRDTAYFIGAGPRFFETMQTPLVSGREFSAADAVGGQPVAIVNEAFARRYFPNGNPLGQFLSARVRGERKDLEIVGLAKDTLAAGLRKPSPATVYVPYLQLTGGFPSTIEVRVSGSLTKTAAALRQMLQPLVPASTVDVVRLSAQVDAAMVQERMLATLAGAFGALALILACVGLYGVLAFSVARRTKEIGIRVALGARRTGVLALVLGGALRLVATGLVIGIPAAWAASQTLQSMLFGLEATDSMTIAAAVLLLLAAACVASYVPARRASQVDPMVALRHD